MNKLMVLPLAALTVGCGDFEPLEGRWDQTSATFSEDGCEIGEEPSEESEEDNSAMTLSLDGEGGFTLLPDSADDMSWTCTLDGHDFVCDDFTAQFDLGALSGGALEGNADLVGSLEGTFTDDTSGEVAMAVNITCEGSGCEIAEFPASCTSTMTGTVAWVE